MEYNPLNSGAVNEHKDGTIKYLSFKTNLCTVKCTKLFLRLWLE
jgi:hypothetical protein